MTTDSSDSCNVVVFDKCDFYAILGILAVYFDTIRQLSHGTVTLSFILSHFVVVVIVVIVMQADCTDVAVLFIEDKARKKKEQQEAAHLMRSMAIFSSASKS